MFIYLSSNFAKKKPDKFWQIMINNIFKLDQNWTEMAMSVAIVVAERGNAKVNLYSKNN